MKDFKFISQRTSPEWASAFDEMPYSLEEKARMNEYIEARREAIYKNFDAEKELNEVIKHQASTAEMSVYWSRMFPNIESAAFDFKRIDRKPQTVRDLNCIESAALYAATDLPGETVIKAVRIFAAVNKLSFTDTNKLNLACQEYVFAHLRIACHAKNLIKLMRPFEIAGILKNKKFREVVPTPNHDTRVSGHKAVAEAIKLFLKFHAPTLLGKLLTMPIELVRVLDEIADARIWLGLHFPKDNEESVRFVNHFDALVTEYMSWNW